MKALRTTDHKSGSYFERRLGVGKLSGSDKLNPGLSSMNAEPSSDAAIPDTPVVARMNQDAPSVHQLVADHSEGRSSLLDAVRRSGMFEVRMTHLTTGDYLIDDDVARRAKDESAISPPLWSTGGCFRRWLDLLTATTDLSF